jgi:glucose/mannose transport system substrate-binding protein
VPVPATAGKFAGTVDVFPLTKGAPDRDNAILLLRHFASRAGQDLFNPQKGSISARTDSDLSQYDVLAKDVAAAYASAVSSGGFVPNISMLVGGNFNIAFETTMQDYMTARLSGASAATLKAIVESFLVTHYSITSQ